jgi:hypothetical protein
MHNNHTKHWEYGSDFHWLTNIYGDSTNALPSDMRLFSSGRGALKSLLNYGIRQCGWNRIIVPTYYCEDVTESIIETGMELSYYHDSPVLHAPDLSIRDFRKGDVILLVNYFGLREKIDIKYLKEVGVAIIEDHSHDPWSAWAKTSEADYCIASLRKTLPIPDGGMLWSPLGHKLPENPKRRSQDSNAAHEKICGMLLKSMYLEGQGIDKKYFFELIKNGESSIGLGMPAAPSPVLEVFLNTFPISKWDSLRQENYQLFCTSIADVEGICFNTLKPANSNQIPFNIALVFSHKKLRDAVRESLIKRRVYSVILWEISKHNWSKGFIQEREFSERILAIPCDGRYKHEDVLRVSDILKSAIK